MLDTAFLQGEEMVFRKTPWNYAKNKIIAPQFGSAQAS